MRELQELRHSEHANFISALSEIRAAHSAELARIQEAHRNDLAMVVETQRKGMEQIADALRMLNEPRR
jgi:hypothetical protein